MGSIALRLASRRLSGSVDSGCGFSLHMLEVLAVPWFSTWSSAEIMQSLGGAPKFRMAKRCPHIALLDFSVCRDGLCSQGYTALRSGLMRGWRFSKAHGAHGAQDLSLRQHATPKAALGLRGERGVNSARSTEEQGGLESL